MAGLKQYVNGDLWQCRGILQIFICLISFIIMAAEKEDCQKYKLRALLAAVCSFPIKCCASKTENVLLKKLEQEHKPQTEQKLNHFERLLETPEIKMSTYASETVITREMANISLNSRMEEQSTELVIKIYRT